MKSLMFISIAILLGITPVKVFGQNPDPAPGPAPGPAVNTQKAITAPEKKYTISLSPLHLILPVAEITGEMKIMPKLSVAGILGAGKVDNFKVWELGAQAKYYFLGNFAKGLMVGVETTYLGVAGSTDNYDGSGTGLTAGAFVGGKYSFGFGLALELQVGYQAMLIAAEASNQDTSTSDTKSESGVLLNLNIGYTF